METQLRRLPRVYRTLFHDTKYKGGDIGVYLSQLEVARSDLERADPSSKVSDGIMGFLAFRRQHAQ